MLLICVFCLVVAPSTRKKYANDLRFLGERGKYAANFRFFFFFVSAPPPPSRKKYAIDLRFLGEGENMLLICVFCLVVVSSMICVFGGSGKNMLLICVFCLVV